MMVVTAGTAVSGHLRRRRRCWNTLPTPDNDHGVIMTEAALDGKTSTSFAQPTPANESGVYNGSPTLWRSVLQTLLDLDDDTNEAVALVVGNLRISASGEFVTIASIVESDDGE